MRSSAILPENDILLRGATPGWWQGQLCWTIDTMTTTYVSRTRIILYYFQIREKRMFVSESEDNKEYDVMNNNSKNNMFQELVHVILRSLKHSRTFQHMTKHWSRACWSCDPWQFVPVSSFAFWVCRCDWWDCPEKRQCKTDRVQHSKVQLYLLYPRNAN